MGFHKNRPPKPDTMMLTEKVKLLSAPEHREVLWRLSDKCRVIYNLTNAWIQDHYKKTGKYLGVYIPKKALPAFKKDKPEFKEVHSQVMQEMLLSVGKAYKIFFDNVKKDPAHNPPGYKSHKEFCSMKYIGTSFSVRSSVSVNILSLTYGNHLKLDIPFKIRTGVKITNPKTADITYDENSDTFYASITYEVSIKEPDIRPRQGIKVLSFDPGRNILLCGFNGKGFVEYHSETVKKVTKHFDRQIDKVKSLKDKSKKGFTRQRRLKKALNRLQKRKSAQVRQVLHSISKHIVKEQDADVYVFGDIKKQRLISKDPEKGKGNQNINRAFQNNTPLKRLFKMIKYKANLKGKGAVLQNEGSSTTRCHACGHVFKESLNPSVRWYICPDCNLKMGRDHNASVNQYNEFFAPVTGPRTLPKGNVRCEGWDFVFGKLNKIVPAHTVMPARG